MTARQVQAKDMETSGLDCGCASWLLLQKLAPGRHGEEIRRAVTQVGRTLLALVGGGGETSKVATRSLHDLSARLISGESVKFDMFKGKVLLVVNVATQ
ncbi:unnamed protein product [Cladocopium goreaui]|uniref:Glutathione peroxidase n=1 Tax=Cladocopium goreaui TaxID=2562237 RepID=A0A9P1DJT6_9DINO|nr:unnamed protein product [Cladocopium goreaui]